MNLYSVAIDRYTYNVVADSIPSAVLTANEVYNARNGFYSDDVTRVERGETVHGIQKGLS